MQVDAETALVKASKATSEKLDALVQKKMEVRAYFATLEKKKRRNFS